MGNPEDNTPPKPGCLIKGIAIFALCMMAFTFLRIVLTPVLVTRAPWCDFTTDDGKYRVEVYAKPNLGINPGGGSDGPGIARIISTRTGKTHATVDLPMLQLIDIMRDSWYKNTVFIPEEHGRRLLKLPEE